jgi:deoxyribodipyrimidine photo-lyase
MSRAVMWFRRDLRLADNPALAAALANHSDVVPLFVLDPALLDVSGMPRRAFLMNALRDLDVSMNGALVLRSGNPVDEVAAVAQEVGAHDVFIAGDFAPYGMRRDAAVRTRLESSGCRLHVVGSPYAVDPGTVTKDDGSPYSVFTPFSRRWLECGWNRPIDAPSKPSWCGRGDVASEPLPEPPAVAFELPPSGEEGAHAQWAEFRDRGDDGLDGYAERRNLPGVPGSSRLSTALRWGLVHPRQLLADLRTGKSHESYRSELAWREFYADVLYRVPESSWRNLNRKLDGIEFDTGERAQSNFATWCRGETGYPIVDAAMRELLTTGWMHNRTRMIVASFLVKDLHLPWQWGAKFFMQHLVDGDLASNAHGWQWTAGTGTDAAPYFRVFNPVLQGERYDPDGDYVRRFVPELEALPAGSIHAPFDSKRKGSGVPLGYVPPIVDHSVERDVALARYKALD